MCVYMIRDEIKKTEEEFCSLFVEIFASFFAWNNKRVKNVPFSPKISCLWNTQKKKLKFFSQKSDKVTQRRILDAHRHQILLLSFRRRWRPWATTRRRTSRCGRLRRYVIVSFLSLLYAYFFSFVVSRLFSFAPAGRREKATPRKRWDGFFFCRVASFWVRALYPRVCCGVRMILSFVSLSFSLRRRTYLSRASNQTVNQRLDRSPGKRDVDDFSRHSTERSGELGE